MIYEECEECCAGYSKREEPKKLTNLNSLVADHLSANGSLKIDSNTYTLISSPKLCPNNASIISKRPWDLQNIETEPMPDAYFEVTFHEFNELSHVGIGVGNQIFTPVKLLGAQQNSFGYLNNGMISQNESKSYKNIMPSFKPGDVVGAGILFDSFNQRRLFFTKNGSLIGMFPDRVHKGMDCFSGVSFTNNSRVSFTINNNGPFLFDTSSFPNYRNDQTPYISQLPDEIVAACLNFAVRTPVETLEMRLVSKKVRCTSVGQSNMEVIVYASLEPSKSKFETAFVAQLVQITQTEHACVTRTVCTCFAPDRELRIRVPMPVDVGESLGSETKPKRKILRQVSKNGLFS
jgi:hypothetical protein